MPAEQNGHDQSSQSKPNLGDELIWGMHFNDHYTAIVLLGLGVRTYTDMSFLNRKQLEDTFLGEGSIRNAEEELDKRKLKLGTPRPNLD